MSPSSGQKTSALHFFCCNTEVMGYSIKYIGAWKLTVTISLTGIEIRTEKIGKRMLARDIRIEELINTDPEKGFPLFGSNRIMVTGISSLKRFGDDLTKTLGLEKLGLALTRLGYEAGMTAAMTIADACDFDTPLEWFKARTVIFAKSGIVDEEITELHLDMDKSICLVLAPTLQLS